MFIPNFHCELNHIKRVWGQAKVYIRMYTSFTLPRLRHIVNPAQTRSALTSSERKYRTMKQQTLRGRRLKRNWISTVPLKRNLTALRLRNDCVTFTQRLRCTCVALGLRLHCVRLHCVALRASACVTCTCTYIICARRIRTYTHRADHMHTAFVYHSHLVIYHSHGEARAICKETRCCSTEESKCILYLLTRGECTLAWASLVLPPTVYCMLVLGAWEQASNHGLGFMLLPS